MNVVFWITLLHTANTSFHLSRYRCTFLAFCRIFLFFNVYCCYVVPLRVVDTINCTCARLIKFDEI